MFLSDKDFNIDNSEKAKETIRRLDSLLSTFIQNKRYVSNKMTKGFLDYHGLNNEKFKWRFEAMLNDSGENIDKYDENADIIPRTKDSFVSPENFYGMEYEVVKIGKDKTDEYANDIISRNFSVGVKSIPYNDIRYVFNNLLNKKFDTHLFKNELEKAQWDAAIKGTGFLRVCFYDKEQTFKSLKNSPIKTKSGVSIERVDPEDVFVDTGATNPKELFIVSSYEVSELINKFPILKKKNLIKEADTNNILGEDNVGDNYIKKTWRRPRHTGETLLELYTLKDLQDERYSYLFGGVGEQNGIIEAGDTSQYTVFSQDFGSFFFNKFSNSWTDTPENRKKQQYEVVEYYDINRGLYIVYIDDIILYQGAEEQDVKDKRSNPKGIPEPFKDLPIVPIYMDNKYTNFFGEPLVEQFTSFQNMISESDHAQRISMLLTGQEMLMIDSSQLDSAYHADNRIQITKNSPITTIHIKPQLLENKLLPAITPVPFSNNSSVIHQNRKNDLYGMSERQFPSLKAIVASNAPEAQRDTMYSRDLRVNLIIKRQCNSLSDLAYKVFLAVIYELQYFSPDPKLTIPMYEGASAEVGFTIADNETKLKSLRQSKGEELDKLYENMLTERVNEYEKKPDIINPIIEKVRQEILMSVIQSPNIQKFFPNGLGNSPEEQSANIQAIIARPEIVNVIRQAEASQLENIVKVRLTDMAKQEVQPIPDKNYYFSIESLNNYTKLIDLIKFSFDKSRLERENEATRFANLMTPLGQLGGFTLNLREVAKEIAIASGYDPAIVIADKVMSPAKMYELINTKNMLSQNLSLDKLPLFIAKMANEQLGSEVYTEEQVVKSIMGLKQMENNLEMEKIAARNTSKAETDIIKNQAMEQTKMQINQAQTLPQSKPDQQNPSQQ